MRWPIMVLLALISLPWQISAQSLPDSPTSDRSLASTCEVRTEEWNRLLELALEASPEARAALEELGCEVRLPECLVKLKGILLEEWKRPSKERDLESPRLVWLPMLDLRQNSQGVPEVKSPLVIILGEVSPDGAFQDLRLKMSSGNQRVDQLCLEHAAKARFRPARDGQRYRAAKAAITVHLHLQ